MQISTTAAGPSNLATASPARPGASTVAGWAALCLTLIVWAGFSLSIRAIGASVLTPGDVALIRFLVPAVAMLPFLRSRWPALRALPMKHWAMIGGGAGLPFFLIAAAGGRLTSAAHVSALIAGTVPLSFALLGWLIWREPVDAARKRCLAVIVAGVVLLVAGLGTFHWGVLGGAAVLLSASLLWGLYTHGLRKSGLDPLACVMVVTYPSLFLLAPLMGAGVLESHLGQVGWRDTLPFILAQGVGVGLLSTLGYSLSIRLLGPVRCATAGAMAPVLATLMAVPLLGEQPSLTAFCGVLAVTAGVLLASRPPRR